MIRASAWGGGWALERLSVPHLRWSVYTWVLLELFVCIGIVAI